MRSLARRATFDAHEADRLHELDGVTLAPFARRLAAFVLDLLVVIALHTLVWLPQTIAERKPGEQLLVHFHFFHGWESLASVVAYFGIVTFVWKGRTVGKRLCGIRVVSTAHARLTLWQSIERALGYGASALEGGFGFAQYFLHPNRRTVHDRIAETIVVREERRPLGA